MTDHIKREVDLDRVLLAADQVSGDRHESLRWLRRPLKEFDEQTPEELVSLGRVEDVIDYLNSISSGYVG